MRILGLMVLVLGVSILMAQKSSDPVSVLRRGFLTPSDDARIMMRWWWFGSAVTKPELEGEMNAMKYGGIGGFEAQPVYPLVLDDPAADIKNILYL